MNIKHILLIPGAIALSLTVLTIIPASAQAQSTPTVQMQKRQSKLNLTAEQKTQIQQIRQNTKAEVDSYLRSQGITLPQGTRDREAMKSLNLTDAQKARIKEIRQASKEKISQILSPEQRAQMQQRRSNWKGQRQQGRPNQPQVQPPQTQL